MVCMHIKLQTHIEFVASEGAKDVWGWVHGETAILSFEDSKISVKNELCLLEETQVNNCEVYV